MPADCQSSAQIFSRFVITLYVSDADELCRLTPSAHTKNVVVMYVSQNLYIITGLPNLPLLPSG